MHVYTTRYALTEGIEEADVTQSVLTPGLVSTNFDGGSFASCYHGEGRQWHRTKESAIACAEKMRQSKIKSLEKALAKLHALKFA